MEAPAFYTVSGAARCILGGRLLLVESRAIGGATGECPRIAPRRNGIRDRDSRRVGRVCFCAPAEKFVDSHLSQGTVSSKEMSGNEDTHLLYRHCRILFIFILFYLFLFYFILFYFHLFYFILFYFILFYFILLYYILFYFIYRGTTTDVLAGSS